jgi:hypothetical protein
MATGLVRTDDPCFSWGDSIVEAVSETTDRLVRWRGIDFVVRPNDRPGMSAVDSLRSNDSPLVLPEELADAVRRYGAREPIQGDRERLVQATAHTTSQSVGLSSPLFDNIGGLHQPEADLDDGLADVWTQERLPRIWPKTESAQFVPAEDVPDFAFAGRNPAAAMAARALMTEIVRQQGGTPAGPEDYSELSDWLISQKPEERYGEILSLLPGTDELSPRDLLRAEVTLRNGFAEAVAKNDPSLAAAAVQAASEKIDPELRRLVEDSALAPASGAITAGAGYSATGPSTIQPGRSQRELG